MSQVVAPPASSISSGRSLGDRALIAVEVGVGIAVVAALVGQTYGAASTVIFLLACLAAAYSLYTIVRMVTSVADPMLEVAARTDDDARGALEHEKLLILQGIKELEADAAVGKVDAADYQHLRTTAEARALAIIEEIKKADEHYTRKAEELVARRLGITAPATVPASKPASVKTPAKQSKAARAQRPVVAGVFLNEDTNLTTNEGKTSCDRCGFDTPAESKFCAGCGRAVKEAA